MREAAPVSEKISERILKDVDMKSKFSSKIKEAAGRAASVSTFLSKVELEQQQKVTEEKKSIANHKAKVRFGPPVRPPVRDPHTLRDRGSEEIQRDTEVSASSPTYKSQVDDSSTHRRDSIIDDIMYDIDLSSGSDSVSTAVIDSMGIQHKQIDKAFKKIFTKPTTKGRGDASNSNITAIKATILITTSAVV